MQYFCLQHGTITFISSIEVSIISIIILVTIFVLKNRENNIISLILYLVCDIITAYLAFLVGFGWFFIGVGLENMDLLKLFF